MSDKRAFSIDEILDDIKRKKGTAKPVPSAGSVDIDSLIADIVREKERPAETPQEEAERPEAEVIRETVMSEEPEPVRETEAEEAAEEAAAEEAADAIDEPEESEPTLELKPEEPAQPEPEEKKPEKFVVSFDFDQTNPDIHGKPNDEINPNADASVSTVTLLAEAAADQLGRRRVPAREEPEEETPEEPAVAEDAELSAEEEPEAPDVLSEGPGPDAEEIQETEEAPEEETEPAEEAGEVSPDEAQEDIRTFPEEKPEEEDDGYLEYRAPEDEREVYTQISSARSRLILRIILLLVFGGISLAGLLLQRFAPSILPDLFIREQQPLFYLIVQFVLLISCVLCCSTMIGEGLLSALKLKANRDSLAALASLAVLVQTVACFFDIDSVSNTAVHFYTPIIAGILLFSCMAKLMKVNRMILNFRAITSSCDKYVTATVSQEDAATELTRGLVTETPVVAVQKKVGFVSDFVNSSTDETVADRYSKILTPIGFCAAVLLAVASWFLTKDLFTAFTTAAATACFFAPFSYLFASQIPLSRAAKKYSRDGGAILSLEGLEEFIDVNAAAVTAQALFPGNAVRLFGIKTFAGQRIDDALTDAASVVHESGSILSVVFDEITNGDRKLLRPVDSLVYEDGMGVSAWVANKRVLIGSRELMINHGISVPSRDYEERFLNEGHELIYLSTSGELTAVFLVKLFAEPEVKKAIRRLRENGIPLTVHSVDAVVTKEKLAEIFKEDPSFFKILPARLHPVYEEQTAPEPSSSGPVLGIGSIQSFAGSLIGAKRIRSGLLLGNVIQFAAIGLGVLLMIFLTLISGMREMTEISLFFYQILWLLATLLIPRLRAV